MFQPVDPDKSLPQLEHDIIQHWNINKIFEKSVLQRQDSKKFIFFDGPPFANGLPHYGHILALSIKDAITRYQTMKGHYVPRTNGWDCHGLPVEYEIEKNLEISGHKDILELGIETFNSHCRASVFKYTNEWDQMFERIGRWYDDTCTYATLENQYMESIWWVFKQIWDKSLVYKGYRVMHVCPRCETSLSNFEVSQGYKDITDLSAIIKFPLLDQENTYLLAWTTTPWTLPGNQALAIGADIEYVKVKFQDANYIVAKKQLEYTFKDQEYQVLEDVSPQDLQGQKYKPVFDYYKNLSENNFQVLIADFVTTEDGTGIVHIAGGFGEDDYNLCKEHDLDPIQHVGLNGNFKEEVTDFAQKFFKGQDQNICKFLQEKNLLFRSENYKHSYPHCWRDGTPLMNYALDSWFIEVTKIKNQLLANNKKINWQPEHIKEGRFGKWLDNVKDWNISRNRFWGCPMPVWECDTCDHTEAISSISELKNRSNNGNNIIFVRHGHSEHNQENILNSNLNDVKNLTEQGKQQTYDLVNKLKSEGKKIDLIFSSPFPRTIQTAEILSKELKKEVVVSELLTELDCGIHDGQSPENIYQDRKNTDNPYSMPVGETGESLQQVEDRLVQFLDEVSSQHSNKTILVVTHAACIKAIKRHFAQEEPTASYLNSTPNIEYAEHHEFYVGNGPTRDGKLDLHRPYIDEIKFDCPECAKNKKKGTMSRISEVFDCWFESGSMPYAQLHYPFKDKEEFEENFPADFIAEGLDQTRGWFYTLHVLSTILFDKPAFKNVIVNGILLAKDGEKMSKSKKNYPDPTELFDTKGVDSVRLFLYQSTAALADAVRFSEDHVDEIFKKFTLTLYNTYSFFVTYGNIDHFDPAIDSTIDTESLHELDRWLLSEFNNLITEVTTNMDNYNLQRATRPLMEFIDNLSNWYIRRSRRRFWKSENDKDKKQAYATLYYVLTEFCKLTAPFTPFISETIYRNLTNQESVHLQNWPEVNPNLIDKTLNTKMSVARTIVSLGHAIRAQQNLKVRQPLSRVKIAIENKQLEHYILELQDVIKEELNVKELEILDNPDKEVITTLKPDAKVLGPILGPKMKDVFSAIRENKFTIEGKNVLVADQKLDLSNFQVMYQAKEGFHADSQDGIVVILDTKLTKPLIQEGQVRDLVRLIQEFRKEMNYDVSDRIYLSISSENADLTEAIKNFSDYIKSETLAIDILAEEDKEWDSEKLVDIEDLPVTISIIRN